MITQEYKRNNKKIELKQLKNLVAKQVNNQSNSILDIELICREFICYKYGNFGLYAHYYREKILMSKCLGV